MYTITSLDENGEIVIKVVNGEAKTYAVPTLNNEGIIEIQFIEKKNVELTDLDILAIAATAMNGNYDSIKSMMHHHVQPRRILRASNDENRCLAVTSINQLFISQYCINKN